MSIVLLIVAGYFFGGLGTWFYAFRHFEDRDYRAAFAAGGVEIEDDLEFTLEKVGIVLKTGLLWSLIVWTSLQRAIFFDPAWARGSMRFALAMLDHQLSPAVRTDTKKGLHKLQNKLLKMEGNR
jgi:hypothetical protein